MIKPHTLEAVVASGRRRLQELEAETGGMDKEETREYLLKRDPYHRRTIVGNVLIRKLTSSDMALVRRVYATFDDGAQTPWFDKPYGWKSHARIGLEAARYSTRLRQKRFRDKKRSRENGAA